MNGSVFVIQTMIGLLLSALDLYISLKAVKKPGLLGKNIALASALAAVVTLSYLYSVNTGNPLLVSVMSTVYFAGIDWMLVALVHFSCMVTCRHRTPFKNAILILIKVIGLMDTAALIANIFTGGVVGYIPLEPVGIAYEMKPLYVAHLVFTYALVLLVVGVLLHKCLNTPRQYRNQYRLILAAIFLVVLINAVYLYTNTASVLTKLDYSVAGYSLGLFMMYWAAFKYRDTAMLRSLSMTIFENIDQGIVLFDYQNELIMHNVRADQMLGDVVFTEKMPCAEFLSESGVTEQEGDQYSVQCDGKTSPPLRCDFRRIRDKRGGAIGGLYVFTDISEKMDLTSGFELARDFLRAGENADSRESAAVAVFDILGLKELNRVSGRDAGDLCIRELAKNMREYLPRDAWFLRGYEATLIAVCPCMTEKEALTAAGQAAAACESAVYFGVSAAGDRTLTDALDTAERALHVKKLLSPGSARSHALTSLVRALEEADSDTEAHVRRTQKMGAAFGERIGLTDAQMTDLRLLCLLHDIGKIGIPLEILNKPGKLTADEWAVLQSHAEKGYQIARSSNDLKAIADMILCHHERWDGQGYPRKIAGEDIPLLSRIIAIVDSYDAMVNDRSYRKAKTPEEAQEEIRRCAGAQFDPRLAKEFLALLEENPEIAAGENTGGEDVRLFSPADGPEDIAGSTEAIPYSRYLLDMEERIIEADAQFEALTGYAPKDILGKMSQFDLIPPEDRAHYIAQVNKQFTKGSIAYLRHNILRKNGEKIQVVCCGKRYFDSVAKAYRAEIIVFEAK